AVLLVAGTGVPAADHLVTWWAQRSFAASPVNWLDRSHLGPARELLLPESNEFVGAQLESWNRDLRGIVVLQAAAPDAFARSVARVREDGRLEIDGRPAPAQLLVVNAAGTQIGLEGRIVARPRPDLVAYRIPWGAHVRWLARGLFPDRWSGTRLRYQVWPERGSRSGRYVLRLALPHGFAPRRVTMAVTGGAKKSLLVRSGRPVGVALPAHGARPPLLRLWVDVQDVALSARTVGVRVLALRYVRSS